MHLFSRKRVRVHQVHRLLNEQYENVWRLSTENGFKAKIKKTQLMQDKSAKSYNCRNLKER